MGHLGLPWGPFGLLLGGFLAMPRCLSHGRYAPFASKELQDLKIDGKGTKWLTIVGLMSANTDALAGRGPWRSRRFS